MIIGNNPINGGKMEFTSQVANIVKPLVSANEMVDADNIILMHKDGGIIKHLTPEQMNRVIAGIKQMEGAEVLISRKKS